MKKLLKYFSTFEWVLLIVSVAGITVTHFLSQEQKSWLALVASLFGVVSLLLIAKGNLWGIVLTMVFSLIYCYMSFVERLYGELLTYGTMTLPSNIVALVSWIKNPFKGQKTQVAISKISTKKVVFTFATGVVATVALHFGLKALNTASLWISTISVFTSWIAVLLGIFRSRYYALGYVANDIVLIVLWAVQSVGNLGNLCMVACFVIFLINDLYAFINWGRMQRAQQKISEQDNTPQQ